MKKVKENEVSPQAGDSNPRPSDAFPKTSQWDWNEQHSQAAIMLASGYTQQATADHVGVDRRSITNWLQNRDFAAEVDRLSLMVDVSSRAERLRIAMRAIRQKVREDGIDTDKDVLDWLKFAQSETDGVKLDLSKLAALGENETPVADRRSTGTGTQRESAAESRDQGSTESSGSGME